MAVGSLAPAWLERIRRAWRVRGLEREVAARRRGPDQVRLANRVRHLGDAYLASARMREAETCLVEALALYRSDPKASVLDLANSLRSIAILREAEGDVERATRHWEEGNRLYGSVDVPTGVAESAGHLALLCLSTGDTAKTRDWIVIAVEAATKSGDPETEDFIRKTKATVEKSATADENRACS